jgi:hypothetical protein
VTGTNGIKVTGNAANDSLNIAHNVTLTDKTTSTTKPGYAGTFTAIGGITRDNYGHVTTLNTKTVTMPTA